MLFSKRKSTRRHAFTYVTYPPWIVDTEVTSSVSLLAGEAQVLHSSGYSSIRVRRRNHVSRATDAHFPRRLRRALSWCRRSPLCGGSHGWRSVRLGSRRRWSPGVWRWRHGRGRWHGWARLSDAGERSPVRADSPLRLWLRTLDCGVQRRSVVRMGLGHARASWTWPRGQPFRLVLSTPNADSDTSKRHGMPRLDG